MLRHNLSTISFDILSDCNLRCCYCRNEYPLKSVLDKAIIVKCISDALTFHNLKRIHLTGGEPTLHPELYELCRDIKKYNVILTISTNGYKINRQLLNDLKSSGVDYLSVSLNGDNASHNLLANVIDAYDCVISTLDYLSSIDFPYCIRMTLTSKNIHDYVHVIDICEKYRAKNLSVRRYIGNKQHLQPKLSTYLAVIRKIKAHADKKDLGLSIHDPILMPYLGISETIAQRYSTYEVLAGCAAGITGCHINATGSVQPCSSLNVTCGDIYNENINLIWETSRVLNKLRERHLEGKCGTCKYKYLCGGCRSSAYSQTENYTESDQFCSML
jgi:radical SAM protein with 4Fe4S-binding SPASM domain